MVAGALRLPPVLAGRSVRRLGGTASPSSPAFGLLLGLLGGLGGLALGPLRFISSIEGQSSLRQSFQGRPRNALDRQPRRRAADRAALLDLPEAEPRPGSGTGEVGRSRASRGRRRSSPGSRRTACPPCSSMIRSMFGRAVLLLAPGLLADHAGAEDLVLVHPGPDPNLARSSRLAARRSRRRSLVQHARGCPRAPRPWSSRRRRSGPSPPPARRSSPASPSAARTA